MDAARQSNLDAVERWYEALASDDLAAAKRIATEDVVVEYPAEGRLRYGGAWNGTDGLQAWADAHDATEEILDLEIEARVAEGALVVVLGRFRGRSVETGRDWSTPFAHAITMRDGHVARFAAYFDTAAAAAAHRS